MAKVKDHPCEEHRHFDNSYYMYIATPKLLKLNICNWIYHKILGILDPLLSEWESAVVGHEHNDKGGIIMGYLLRTVFLPVLSMLRSWSLLLSYCYYNIILF